MAYTAGSTLVRAVMESSTGLPSDRYINDFAFEFDGTPIAANYDNIVTVVSDFYRVVTTGAASVGQFISNAVNRSATHTIDVYHITAGPIGSPVYSESWLGPPTTSSTSGLPTEVAGVLSFHADLTDIPEESGVTHPRARRRGRVFIGPLNINAVDISNAPYRLAGSGSGAFLNTLREAATRLADDAAANDFTWSVWSRADATLRPVVAGWTDNAPDTQRRRGPASTARVTWTV